MDGARAGWSFQTVFQYMILEGKRDDHDGIKQQFAEADAYRQQQGPQPRKQEQQHPGACYSSRFIPHISDKVMPRQVNLPRTAVEGVERWNLYHKRLKSLD